MSNHQQRLEQLQAQEASLVMQLDEIRFLIVGYQNTIKQEQEKTEQATEE
jgi:multidrug resistance efflux pump